MRRALLVVLVAALGGCRPSLKGWWDLEEWRVERDGAEPLVRADAGALVWQAEGSLEDFGAVYVILRYDYDPIGFDLVPDPDAETTPQSWAFEEWNKDLPLELTWVEEGDLWLTVPFTVLELRTNTMMLEGPSPYASTGDGAIWTWSLVR